MKVRFLALLFCYFVASILICPAYSAGLSNDLSPDLMTWITQQESLEPSAPQSKELNKALEFLKECQGLPQTNPGLKELILKNQDQKNIRDLKMALVACLIENSSRHTAEQMEEYFEKTLIPFFAGSHYFISEYLVLLFPFLLQERDILSAPHGYGEWLIDVIALTLRLDMSRDLSQGRIDRINENIRKYNFAVTEPGFLPQNARKEIWQEAPYFKDWEREELRSLLLKNRENLSYRDNPNRVHILEHIEKLEYSKEQVDHILHSLESYFQKMKWKPEEEFWIRGLIYESFEINRGEIPGCKDCKDDWRHLFTSKYFETLKTSPRKEIIQGVIDSILTRAQKMVNYMASIYDSGRIENSNLPPPIESFFKIFLMGTSRSNEPLLLSWPDYWPQLIERFLAIAKASNPLGRHDTYALLPAYFWGNYGSLPQVCQHPQFKSWLRQSLEAQINSIFMPAVTCLDASDPLFLEILVKYIDDGIDTHYHNQLSYYCSQNMQWAIRVALPLLDEKRRMKFLKLVFSEKTIAENRAMVRDLAYEFEDIRKYLTQAKLLSHEDQKELEQREKRKQEEISQKNYQQKVRDSGFFNALHKYAVTHLDGFGKTPFDAHAEQKKSITDLLVTMYGFPYEQSSGSDQIYHDMLIAKEFQSLDLDKQKAIINGIARSFIRSASSLANQIDEYFRIPHTDMPTDYTFYKSIIRILGRNPGSLKLLSVAAVDFIKSFQGAPTIQNVYLRDFKHLGRVLGYLYLAEYDEAYLLIRHVVREFMNDEDYCSWITEKRYINSQLDDFFSKYISLRQAQGTQVHFSELDTSFASEILIPLAQKSPAIRKAINRVWVRQLIEFIKSVDKHCDYLLEERRPSWAKEYSDSADEFLKSMKTEFTETHELYR